MNEITELDLNFSTGNERVGAEIHFAGKAHICETALLTYIVFASILSILDS